MPRSPDRAGLLWGALAALAVPAIGLALMAAAPATPPDVAYAARVQAWRDMPPPAKPGRPAGR